ncbi:hypothetical protein [Jeotgalibacillus campisalis]|uniref:Uncharacterized protein n=1 Tax=Jeotgalibacillus campisalis TaxID=220754 RepID=A0A0C2RN18_9BACL|nr:hypothetical protein [Jeotgalibacillus campisalis]KIL43169.1 hypothetical protein KR50_35720 [Jeotgalibacillus campisalis]
MKLLNGLCIVATGIFVLYVSLKLFTPSFPPALNESFLIELSFSFLLIGLHTFRNWKVEAEAEERYR